MTPPSLSARSDFVASVGETRHGGLKFPAREVGPGGRGLGPWGIGGAQSTAGQPRMSSSRGSKGERRARGRRRGRGRGLGGKRRTGVLVRRDQRRGDAGIYTHQDGDDHEGRHAEAGEEGRLLLGAGGLVDDRVQLVDACVAERARGVEVASHRQLHRGSWAFGGAARPRAASDDGRKGARTGECG